MRLLTIVVVLLLAVLGAGCGGGDEEASSDTDTVLTETTTDGTTTEDTETDTDTDSLDVLASDECRELVDASAAFSQALGAAGTDSENLDEVSALFEEYAERAPEEIRADILVLGEAYAAYADVLADVDLQAGETPDAETIQRLQEALASLDQAEVAAASQRLSVWAQENC